MCTKIEMGKIKELIELLNEERTNFNYLKVTVEIQIKNNTKYLQNAFASNIKQWLENRYAKYGIKIETRLGGIIILKSVIEWSNDIEGYKGLTWEEMAEFKCMIDDLDKESRIKSMIDKFCVDVTIKASHVLIPEEVLKKEIKNKLNIDLGKTDSNNEFYIYKVKACSDDTEND